MLAGDTDTIRNPNYFALKSKIQSIKDFQIISTRKITAEEQNAILSNYIK